MRRAVIAVLVLLLMGTLNTVAAQPSSAVTVLADGTGDSVNLRIEPSMDGSVVGQAHPGDVLQLNGATAVTANGWQWWQIVNGTNGIAYVRADLVGAPQMQVSPASQASSSRPNANLTNTPRGIISDLIIWAAPQSLGGFVVTTCTARSGNATDRYVGGSDCFTSFADNMDGVTAYVVKRQRIEKVVYLSAAPDPPRVYLQGAFTAIGYTDSGVYLAQGLDDKTAVLLVRIVAQQACGYSCPVSVDYYYQQ